MDSDDAAGGLRQLQIVIAALEAHASGIAQAEQAGIATVVQGLIEAQRLLQAELQQQRAARANAEAAVSARDQFLSVAAHELKTPLTSLLGYAQLFQRRADREKNLNERDEHALKVIVEQASRLDRMLQALLDLSRIDRGQLSIKPEYVALFPLATRLIDQLFFSLKDHSISIDCPDELVAVLGDRVHLEQVLQNLIQNAIKYSPHGGVVRVRLYKEDSCAIISVEDQGIGIPQEALPHIFDRFYRVQNTDMRNVVGLGIGLFIVKEIVTLHGGTIDVVSKPGQGSTFTASLPLAVEELK